MSPYSPDHVAQNVGRVNGLLSGADGDGEQQSVGFQRRAELLHQQHQVILPTESSKGTYSHQQH